MVTANLTGLATQEGRRAVALDPVTTTPATVTLTFAQYKISSPSTVSIPNSLLFSSLLFSSPSLRVSLLSFHFSHFFSLLPSLFVSLLLSLVSLLVSLLSSFPSSTCV